MSKGVGSDTVAALLLPLLLVALLFSSIRFTITYRLRGRAHLRHAMLQRLVCELVQCACATLSAICWLSAGDRDASPTTAIMNNQATIPALRNAVNLTTPPNTFASSATTAAAAKVGTGESSDALLLRDAARGLATVAASAVLAGCLTQALCIAASCHTVWHMTRPANNKDDKYKKMVLCCALISWLLAALAIVSPARVAWQWESDGAGAGKGLDALPTSTAYQLCVCMLIALTISLLALTALTAYRSKVRTPITMTTASYISTLPGSLTKRNSVADRELQLNLESEKTKPTAAKNIAIDSAEISPGALSTLTPVDIVTRVRTFRQRLDTVVESDAPTDLGSQLADLPSETSSVYTIRVLPSPATCFFSTVHEAVSSSGGASPCLPERPSSSVQRSGEGGSVSEMETDTGDYEMDIDAGVIEGDSLQPQQGSVIGELPGLVSTSAQRLTVPHSGGGAGNEDADSVSSNTCLVRSSDASSSHYSSSATCSATTTGAMDDMATGGTGARAISLPSIKPPSQHQQQPQPARSVRYSLPHHSTTQAITSALQQHSLATLKNGTPGGGGGKTRALRAQAWRALYANLANYFLQWAPFHAFFITACALPPDSSIQYGALLTLWLFWNMIAISASFVILVLQNKDVQGELGRCRLATMLCGVIKRPNVIGVVA